MLIRAIVLCVCALSLFGQSEVATIGGTISDSTGGVLAGVAVTAKNEATNVSVTTVSNEAGRYLIPSLRPGTYTITTSLAGF